MKLLRKALRTSIPFLMFALLALVGFAQSSGRSVAKPQNLGPEDPARVITVTVWLKQHNKAALDELVRQMYEPGSPNYHRFLTHEKYSSQFAPSAADAAQVQGYLTAHNLTVTFVDKYNHYVIAKGRVTDAQLAFSVQLSQVTFNGRVHRVSNASATVPGPVGELVRGVTGLDDFAPHPAVMRAMNHATGKPVPPRQFSMADVTANSSQPSNCLAGHKLVSF
jgi:subtilase family serine protease